VSQFTRPRPDEELRGLVYGLGLLLMLYGLFGRTADYARSLN
jgi:hypothetical protein